MSLPIIYRDPKQLANFGNHPDFFEHMKVFVDPPVWAGIPTPDFIQPDPNALLPDGITPRFAAANRRVNNQNREMTNDGVNTESVQFWGFFDDNEPGNEYRFPSQPIRLVEGQIFHGFLHNTSIGGRHTIHWHGMEPTSHNDGVGKLSMEVGSEGYEYQWLASAAGTYFYHCHRNTVLHFEMGMYGMLIIDPQNPNLRAGRRPRRNELVAPYAFGGPGYVRRGNDIVPYDVEAIWVSDDVDPVWHGLSHNQWLSTPKTEPDGDNDAQGNDLGVKFTSVNRLDSKGLHNFNPQYFCISGVPHPWTKLDVLPVEVDENLAFLSPIPATVAPGQTLLVRLLCAAYSLNRYTFEGLDVEVIAMDGRVMGQTPYTRYSAPFKIPAGVPFELTAARRFDLLIRPTSSQVGSHRVLVEFQDHITKVNMGIAETFINVVQPARGRGRGEGPNR
ncbi:MAG: multicopper oxidase domain-containing protein [Deltaproteobacteria bacterium]|nr:multicopper oxidase domain-containing protein [Deltaproteobacteria bacterium]